MQCLVCVHPDHAEHRPVCAIRNPASGGLQGLRRCGRTLLVSLRITIAIELVERLYPGSRRMLDIDDIICEVVGMGTGYGGWRLVGILRHHDAEKGVRAACVTVLAVAAFLIARSFVHLPNEIAMPRSQYGILKRITLASDALVQDQQAMPILRCNEPASSALLDETIATSTKPNLYAPTIADPEGCC